TGGAEDEGTGESVLEVGDRRLVAVLSGGEDVFQGGGRLWIGVVGDPGADHLGVESMSEAIGYAGHMSPLRVRGGGLGSAESGGPSQSFATMSARRREMRGAAAAPASMTSAWESGVSWMPAARFVTSEMPMSSRPA